MRFGMEILSPSSYFSHSSWLLHESKSSKWTPEENKLFENALARFDKDTPDRWQKVAAMVPGKTVADVRRQYKELEDDVSSIEAGLFPISGYSASPFTLEWRNGHGFDGLKGPYGGGSGGGGKRASTNRSSEQERKKGVPWTEEEHKLFLLGLKKYGKGDWRNISRNYVITRTPTQVASHAQKYFIRQHSGGKDKRRASIHDITTVNLKDDQSLSPDNNKRAQSSDHVNNRLPHQPISASLAQTHAQWNQLNTGAAALAYNQSHGHIYMAPPNYSNSYGLKVEHDSYMVPQNMGFQMQSGLHYPPR